MRRRNRRIIAIQAVLVLLMSAVASYSLLPEIGDKVSYVFAGLMVVGVIMIFFPRLGVLPFSLLVFFAPVTVILSHSILDLGMFDTIVSVTQGGFIKRGQLFADLNPELSFYATLGIGLFIVTGYLALSYLNSLQKDYRTMTSGEAEINEVEEVANRNLSVIGAALAAGVVMAAVVVVILRLIQPAVADYLKDYPWTIMLLGLAAVLLLAGFLYWVGTSRQKKT